MNSEFERFANQVKEHIFENVADRDNLLIELHNTQKVNQMDQISLTVRHKDCNVAPSVPLSAAFEADAPVFSSHHIHICRRCSHI